MVGGLVEASDRRRTQSRNRRECRWY